MPNLIMRFPNGLKKTLTLSYDDGVEQDIKLLEIAKKYGLKGTVNINSGVYANENHTYEPGTIHRRMSRSQVTKLYSKSDWEVATHAYTHPNLTGLPPVIATEEIYKDRITLENQFNTLVRGFAYPYGAYNDTVVEILKNCGIVYARTVASTHDFFMPKDWLRLEPTCHHNDEKLMELAKEFVELKDPWSPRMFYLWGHSYEFEAYDNWNVLEEFAKYVSGREDIYYATNIEIYDYCEAFSRLRFNAAMTECKNPTDTDIWFNYNDKEYLVQAGQVISIMD